MDQLEQPEQDQTQFGNFSIPYSAEEQRNIIEYQLDPNKEVARLMHVLRGEIWNADTENWEKPKDEDGKKITAPRLNEKGIAAVMAYATMGKTILLSDYDKQKMMMNLRVLVNDLSRDIYDNHDVWNIKNTSDADTVVDMTFTLLLALFSAALDGNMRKYLQKQIRETHTYSAGQVREQPHKKRFGFF